MKIGILGGSFNPPHSGHLILAENVREKLKLDKILFVPANIPPLKGKRPLLSAIERLRMVNLAIEKNPYFESSKAEIKRGGISYTFETLNYFKQYYGKKTRLFFIAGADILKQLPLWKKKDDIFKLCAFVIVARKGFKIPSFLPGNIKILEMNTIDISSSRVRENVRNGRSIRYLVPEKVRMYILKKKIYL